MESRSYVLSFRMVFFYLVTTVWIFDISLCANSINNKKKYVKTPTNTVVLFVFWLWRTRRVDGGSLPLYGLIIIYSLAIDYEYLNPIVSIPKP